MYIELHCKTICFCIYLEYTKMNEFRFEYSCLYYVCIWYTHVCTWYVIVCSVQSLNNVIPFPAPGNFHCELACNPFMIGLDSAYRQELGNLYIHGLSLSVLVKNGSVHMVSFSVTFLPKYV